MRLFSAALFGVLLALPVAAQDDKEPKLDRRYGLIYNRNGYPQAAPKDALASVVKALEEKRVDYVLAHLTDPAWVDERVKQAGNDFDAVVREATAKLLDNPDVLKELRRYVREGDWDVMDKTASATLKDVKDRRVAFRRAEGRWFLENDTKKPEPGK
jgi:hypothetical protein